MQKEQKWNGSGLEIIKEKQKKNKLKLYCSIEK